MKKLNSAKAKPSTNHIDAAIDKNAPDLVQLGNRRIRNKKSERNLQNEDAHRENLEPLEFGRNAELDPPEYSAADQRAALDSSANLETEAVTSNHLESYSQLGTPAKSDPILSIDDQGNTESFGQMMEASPSSAGSSPIAAIPNIASEIDSLEIASNVVSNASSGLGILSGGLGILSATAVVMNATKNTPSTAESASGVVTLNGSIVAGPVVAGNQLTVVVSRADNNGELARVKVNSDGTFSVRFDANYTGVVIAKVIDSDDAGADYLDEASKLPIDLSVNLRAAAVINGAGQHTLVITPITEIAVRQLFTESKAPGGSGLDVASVNSINSRVATVFGLADIVRVKPVAVNDVNFSSAEAESKKYGYALAALSGADQNLVGMEATVAAVANGISSSVVPTVSNNVQRILLQGADTVGAKLGLDIYNVVRPQFNFAEASSTSAPGWAGDVKSLGQQDLVSALPKDVAGLTSTQLSLMTAQQIGWIPPVAMSSLSSSKLLSIGAGISGMTATQAASLSTVQIDALVGSGLIRNLSSEALASLPGAQDSFKLIGGGAGNSGTAPTTQTYKDIGVTGIDAGNIASINDALKGLPGANKDTAAEVQGVVDAYRKVLGVADTVAGNTDAANLPSLADYGKIGVSEVTTVTQAALLGSVIDGKNKIDADTVSEIKALALASNAVLEAAASANGASLSMAQLEQLGIKGVTADNLAAVRQAIADSADDGSAINSLSKLQSVVSATTTQVASVLTGLQSYSGANGQSAPTTQTYKDLAVTGVDADNIAAVNDALKGLPGANKDTAAEVQGVVDAYRKVLGVADTVAGNTDAANLPSLADYGKIGVSEVTTVTQAALLGSVIDAKNLAAVDSVAELRALADAAQAVLTAAALPAGGTSTLSKAQLELLGIKDVTDNNLAVVRQAIANSADDGSAINSLSKLQTLVSGAAFSASDVQLSNDTGSFSTDFVTTVNNQTISAKLNTVISAGDTLEGSVNSGATWEKINSMVTDRAITWTGVTLNSGVNNIVFRLTKQDGSQYLSSAQTYTLDNTAPAAPTLVLDAASDTGISNSDRLTNDATPTISGTAEAGSSVKLYDGITEVGSATAGGDGTWSITPGSALVNGLHTLTVKATDAAGNESLKSSELVVTIDTANPTAVALSKTIIATLAASTGATVGSLSASDTQAISYTLAAGGEHNSQFEIVGADLKVKAAAGLSAGTYNINVKATDAAGNETLQALSFEVVNAPSVSSIVRADNASETVAKGATQLSYTVTFSEAVTDVDASDFVLTTTGSAAASIASVNAGATNATYTVVINGISGDGTVRLDVAAGGTGIKNLKGIELVGGYSSAQTYTLDNTAPAAPTLVLDAASDTGISNSDRLTNDATPTISGTAEAGSSVKLYDGITEVGSATAGGDGTWSITPGSALVNGLHTLTVKATDAAGNESAASNNLVLTVDTTRPTLSSSTPADEATLVSSSANLTLTFDENIALGTGKITLKALDAGGTDLVIDVTNNNNQLSISGNTLTINPTSDLAVLKNYAIQIDSTAIRDAAGNAYAGISDTSTLNFKTFESKAGAPTLDLGSYGKLINGVQVEGNWYYVWDRNGDGLHNGATFNSKIDTVTFTQLASDLGTTASEITESNRTFTINGVTVKLPTYGGAVDASGKATATGKVNGTTYSVPGNDSTPNSNTTYNDLLAIWDAKNGTQTTNNTAGVPAGWNGNAYYWSATPSASGHAGVLLGNGDVADLTVYNGYVAFQVL